MYALISYDGVQYHSPILAMRKGVYANSYVVLNSEYNGLICVPDWKWYRDTRQSVRHVYILDADKSMFAKSKGWLAIPEFACAKMHSGRCCRAHYPRITRKSDRYERSS